MRQIHVALAASLALGGCSPAGGDRNAERPLVREMHFTATDLKRLGCNVETAPRIATVDKPFIGRMESYGWPDGPACASEFLSVLQNAGDDPDGIWAGLDASTRGFARQHGYEVSTYDGNVGEDSQIDVFTSAGEARGFRYTVQNNGHLHSVMLISDRISPSGSFESILREKL